MHQISPEQIEHFMSGQVRCWNNHDKAGLLALYREAAPDLLDIEYVGRAQQADGWLVIEEMYDKHNHQFRLEVVSTIINGNEAAVPAAAGTTSPAAADVRSREVVRSRDRDVR